MQKLSKQLWNIIDEKIAKTPEYGARARNVSHFDMSNTFGSYTYFFEHYLHK
jgi:hypothetical protein